MSCYVCVQNSSSTLAARTMVQAIYWVPSGKLRSEAAPGEGDLGGNCCGVEIL